MLAFAFHLFGRLKPMDTGLHNQVTTIIDYENYGDCVPDRHAKRLERQANAAFERLKLNLTSPKNLPHYQAAKVLRAYIWMDGVHEKTFAEVKVHCDPQRRELTLTVAPRKQADATLTEISSA